MVGFFTLVCLEGIKYLKTTFDGEIAVIEKRFSIINDKLNLVDNRVTHESNKIQDSMEEQFLTSELKQRSQIDEAIIIKAKERLALEQKLQRCNVMIFNRSEGSQGSGTTIEYKGKYYILSAGHMQPNATDEIVLVENGTEICDLVRVKSDYTLNNLSEGESWESGKDLVLLKPKNSEFFPQEYIKLADEEPLTPSSIYHVGNPSGVEDLLSDCRVITYRGNFMYFHGTNTYGSSGCGMYNLEGELVGILSYGSGTKFDNGEYFGITAAVRLSVIKAFLGQAETEGLLGE